MKPWIETKKFWFAMDHVIDDEARGENWRLRRMTPDREALDRWLDTLIAELNDNQWEIKAILPVDRGRMYQEIAPLPPEPDPKRGRRTEARPPSIDAYGVGWGAAVVWSVCVIAQRSTWLPDDDYAKRIATREEGEARAERERRREEARHRNSEVERQIEPLTAERATIMSTTIAFQKSLFGKNGWQFRDKRFPTEAEAEAARAEALGEIDARIAVLRDKIVPMVD